MTYEGVELPDERRDAKLDAAPNLIHPHVLIFQGVPKGQPIRGSERLTPRHDLKIRLVIHIQAGPRKSEIIGETRNVSAQGVYFITNTRLVVGAMVEMPITMPREITGKPAAEYRYTGKIVRVEPLESDEPTWGVGVKLYFHTANL